MNDSLENNDEAPPRLRIKRGAPVGAGPTTPCPQCHADMPKDAVLCVQCGYDARSGQRLRTRTAWPQKLMMGASVLASLAVAVAAVVILVRVLGSSDTGTMLPEPVVPVESEPRATPRPATTIPEKEIESVSVTRITPAEVEQEAPPAAAEDTEPGTTARPDTDKGTDPGTTTSEDPAHEALRRRLQEGLDERMPMYAVGDEVALRRTDGLVHRGQLAGVRDGHALVVDGERRERVRIDELDRDTRLRLDPELRERRIKHRMQQLLDNQ